MKNCLFCNNMEISEENVDSGPPYLPVDRPDFICSSCEKLLFRAVDKEKAYKKAVRLGYHNKARAISLFMNVREIKHDTKAKKPKRSMDRRAAMRTPRSDRGRIRA